MHVFSNMKPDHCLIAPMQICGMDTWLQCILFIISVSWNDSDLELKWQGKLVCTLSAIHKIRKRLLSLWADASRLFCFEHAVLDRNVRITRSFENMRSLRSLSLLTLCSNWHHRNAISTCEYSQKGYVEDCLWMASLWDPVLQNNSLHLNLQHVQCESVLFCVCFPTPLCNLVHQLHHSVLIHTSVCSGHTANPKCVKLGS